MSGPIHLSAADFAAVLEAAGLDPGAGSVEGAASDGARAGGEAAGSVGSASAVAEGESLNVARDAAARSPLPVR